MVERSNSDSHDEEIPTQEVMSCVNLDIAVYGKENIEKK